MAITMYQSERNFVTPANDASLYSALGGDTSGVIARGNKLKITVNGLTATMETGQAIILGRLVEVTEPITFTLPSSSAGNVCIVIDLSKSNTVIGQAGQNNYQVTVNQVYVAGITGNLVQDDINNGGFIYELPLGTFSSTATTATIVQNNPILNDSGWMNLDVGAVNAVLVGNPSYAQYRVRDNVMFLRWRGVDVTKAANYNQIARVPWSLRPDVEIVGAGINNDSSGINPIQVLINDTATIWINAVNNHKGSLTGSLSYPLPSGRF